ncbi:transmembrane protein 119 [Malurus melanocephalus]|uniref:transmembrane protein 119 n=1 Tax=Malurus melanocephalus TaxID=175006 RepID=UPI002546DABC|nr:transmembrane protein 119 [Malurus melanocephalus]
MAAMPGRNGSEPRLDKILHFWSGWEAEGSKARDALWVWGWARMGLEWDWDGGLAVPVVPGPAHGPALGSAWPFHGCGCSSTPLAAGELIPSPSRDPFPAEGPLSAVKGRMKRLIPALQTLHCPSAGQCCDPTAAAVPVGNRRVGGPGVPPTSAAVCLLWINGNQIVQPGKSLEVKSCCWSPSRSPARFPTMGSAMGAWLLLLVLLAVAPAQAAAPRHRPVLPDTAGSGDGEEASATLPVHPVTPRISPTVGDMPGTTVTNSSAPGVLDGLVDFFKEYLLLVVVVGSLSFVLLFIICAAIIVRQKHKASAYYPSSFPKKKYVDERDKSGGARAFSEVPEKAAEAGEEELLDGGRQLQADILAAAQNLKSPPKAPLANGARPEQNSPQEEEEEEEGRKKLGDEQSKPPAQNLGAEEAAGAAGAGGKETPDAPQDGSPSPSGI